MVNDLFQRVIPNLENNVQNQQHHLNCLQDAWNSDVNYRRSVQSQPITLESDLRRSTSSLLETCIHAAQSVGLPNGPYPYGMRTENLQIMANVKTDALVHLPWGERLIPPGYGVLSVEDKTLPVFARWCNDETIDASCGPIDKDQGSYEGFDSIILKMAAYMLTLGISWGLLHGTHLFRVIRIQKNEQSDPYVVISEQLDVDLQPPYSIYAVVTYMLLTAHEDVQLPSLQKIANKIPLRPIDHIVAATRQESHNRRESAEDKQSVVKMLRPRAFSGMGPPIRKISLRTVVPNGHGPIYMDLLRHDSSREGYSDELLHIDQGEMIGAGEFGRVFEALARFRHSSDSWKIVLKIAWADKKESLATEAALYERLRTLQGTGIPRCYGLFAGHVGKIGFSILILEHCGKPLASIKKTSFRNK